MQHTSAHAPSAHVPDKEQTCGHALNKTSDISLEKVVGTAPDLTDMYKDAKTSLRKSDRLGDRAAVYLVIDRPYLMKNNSTVQRLSDQILSLPTHLDDDGKVLVGVASSSGTHTLTRCGLVRHSQAFVDVALGPPGPRRRAAQLPGVTPPHYPRTTSGFRFAERRWPTAIFTHSTPAKARSLHARIHDRRLRRGVPSLREFRADLR